MNGSVDRGRAKIKLGDRLVFGDPDILAVLKQDDLKNRRQEAADNCKECHGKKIIHHEEECPQCEGTGEIEYDEDCECQEGIG